MWMCDRCQSILDDDKTACPKCGWSPPTPGAPIPAASGGYAPQFGVSQSVDAPPVIPEPASAPLPVSVTTSAPPIGVQTGGSDLGTKLGVAAILGLFLVRLLNPLTLLPRLIALAIGLGLIWGGHWFAHKDDAFKRTAVRTTARVVALEERDDHFYPVAEFTTAEGQIVRVKSGAGSKPASAHVGDSVTVYYNAQAPNDAILDDHSMQFVFWILTGMGALIIVLSVFGRNTPGRDYDLS